MGRMGRIALGTVLVLAVAAGAGAMIHLDSEISSSIWDSEVSSVVVDSGEVEDIEEEYTSEEARAWCLFGEVQENEDEETVKVVVEEVVRDSDAESGTERVEWDCQQGISAPSGADYIGHVHSHPSDMSARPSSRDEATGNGGATVMGIYNGDELNFFAGENIQGALEGATDRVYQVEFELR